MLLSLMLLCGELKAWFKGQRAIRLGDLMCLFLFILVMDVLSWMLTGGTERGLVRVLYVEEENVEI